MRFTSATWSYTILLIAISFTPAAGDDEGIRVLCFNILQGGRPSAANVGFSDKAFPGGRLKHIADVIRKTRADIVCVQEDASGHALLDALGRGWHKHGRVYSRFPVERISTHARLDVARATLPGGRTLIVGSGHWWPADGYGPFKARDWIRKHGKPDDAAVLERAVLGDPQRSRSAADYAITLATLKPFLDSGEPIVIGCDFNEPSHLDWTARYARRGADRWVKNPTGEPLRQKIAWRGSQRLAEAGMRDVYRLVHPDEVEKPGNTWTPPYRDGTQGRVNYSDQVLDRIDRIYIAGPLTATNAWVVGEGSPAVEIKIDPWPSDHRAVLVHVRLDQ